MDSQAWGHLFCKSVKYSQPDSERKKKKPVKSHRGSDGKLHLFASRVKLVLLQSKQKSAYEMLCIQQAILNNRGIWEVPKLALRKHLMAEVEQRTNDSSRSPKTSSPSSLITVSAVVAGSPRCLLAIGPLRRAKPTSPAATICIWPASTNMFHLL